MIDHVWIKQNETKNRTKTEIVCEIRKQLKLAASGHWSLEKDKIDSRRKAYNFVETAVNISSEAYKTDSWKYYRHLNKI